MVICANFLWLPHHPKSWNYVNKIEEKLSQLWKGKAVEAALLGEEDVAVEE
jgi:hypothetical protein